MGGNITLFSGYNSSENRTTNYCLLVLKALYVDNPKHLEEILISLLGEKLGDLVGVKFRQQEGKGASVPDGLITQKAFTIYIEAKNWNWFYDSQLEAHLEALDKENPGVKILIALGNFDDSATDQFNRIRSICEKKYRKTVVFAALSYEDLLSACEALAGLSKNLLDMLADFRQYLEEQGVLSSWERILDVVNCAGLPQEVMEGNVYICPTAGGAYSHTRSKYFGMYRSLKVERIAIIEAVVDLDSRDDGRVKWKNLKGRDEDYLHIAREKHRKWRKDEFPNRVFILGPLIETAFHKGTKGGMFGSKRYFDVSVVAPKNAEDLADKLKEKTWPEKSWIVTP